MKKFRLFFLFTILLTVLAGISSCSPKVTTSTLKATDTVNTWNVSYNELTMNLDSEPITYTIDISTEAGRMRLNKLSVEEADNLALIEAIMANKCATIFQPQFTHLVQGGNVLRVTIYGFPARYKNVSK